MTEAIKQAAVEAAVDSVVKAAAADPSRLFLFMACVAWAVSLAGVVYLFLIHGAPLIGCTGQ
jgi:hypothetical protein